MSILRTRVDVTLVIEKDEQAVQYDLFTTLRDQLELSKRWPKIAEDPATASIKLVYVAAQRNGIVDESVDFDAFVDMVLDLQISEAAPLVKG